ncbi:nucleoside kinase [Baileyella intestinalis]|uniref:nucleoside kinase n=1 Tax=Baileyella intestinalis TaxID=2606709 RepID=UPI002A76359A|nr:nucleoside kinase [Baileyella intestinalis]
MMKIHLSPGQDIPYEEFETGGNVTAEDVLNSVKDRIKYSVYAALIDNKVMALNTRLTDGVSLRFLDIRSKQAFLMYQNSLVMLLLAAAKDIIGDQHVEVRMTLNQGLYIEVTSCDVNEDQVAKIGMRMNQLIDMDLPFETGHFTKSTGRKLMLEEGLDESSRVFDKLRESDEVRIYKLNGYSDFFFTDLVPSTGYLKYFELMKYRDGILLRFAQPENPDRIPLYADEYIMYRAFKEQSQWNHLLGVKYVADLNEKIRAGKSFDLIQMSEALHDKKIVEIADAITAQKKRVVLVLGPSSSGKTTFARRLIVHLKVRGLDPLYVGTDDYFKERENCPRDENGEYDFEGIDALDLDLFNRQMKGLLAGEEVDMPVFDFITGHKEYGKRITQISGDQPIIIEGIHSFDSVLTQEIDESEKFRIYISPLTHINLNAHNRIPTTDTRIVRRIIRDSRTRGANAAETLKIWKKVHAGENKNIFPHSGEADMLFNSVHVYELAVLKKYAVPLLKEIPEDDTEYPEAERLLKLFEFVESLEDDQLIANTSILREFIGGGVFA